MEQDYCNKGANRMKERECTKRKEPARNQLGSFRNRTEVLECKQRSHRVGNLHGKIEKRVRPKRKGRDFKNHGYNTVLFEGLENFSERSKQPERD